MRRQSTASLYIRLLKQQAPKGGGNLVGGMGLKPSILGLCYNRKLSSWYGQLGNYFSS